MTAPQNTKDDAETSVERGVQYPADNLAEALVMLEKVKAAIGLSAAKRELIANALGYKSMSGHAARRLGSLSHFGLLERAGKGAARISPLGKAILMPTSDEERARSIVEAVRTPNLFATLIAKYSGHALPSMLTNLLAREHGVNASGSEAAANTFRESVEFAGLLKNGVLSSEVAVESRKDSEREPDKAEPGPGAAVGGSNAAVPKGDTPTIDAPETAHFTISLDPRKGRVAKIAMPIPVTTRDLKNVEAWVAYMKLTMHDEEAPDLSGN